MLKWHAAAITDAGCQRPRNEDNYYMSPDHRVFVVADGMGGAVGGATASRLAVEAIAKKWQDSPPDTSDLALIRNWLKEAVDQANLSIWHGAKDDISMRGMGTTVVIAVQADNNFLQIAHVGDSRAYLVRGGASILLTNDHSVVQEMVRAGRLTEEQARVNPYKNLITRCLGHQPEVELDQTPVEVHPNDWIILCSDGLPTVLRDDEIGQLIADGSDPEKICNTLVKQTLDGGAPDNVTVVAIRYSQINGDGK